MDFLVQTILPYLLLYKYGALFTITFLAAVIVPIPSGSFLMAAAAFAGQGYFNLTLVVVIACIANILGDITGYFLARRYGENVLQVIGLKKLLVSSKGKHLEQKFLQKKGLLIFISRFEVLATLTVNLLSGLTKVPIRKFLLYEISGTFAQVAFYASIGYFFGSNWQTINRLIGNLMGLIIFGTVLVLLLVGKRVKRFSSHNT